MAGQFEPERLSEVKEIEEFLTANEKADRPTALLFEMPMDPPKNLMSRLLAKMTLEMLSLRMLYDSSLVNQLIDQPHWDPLRRWARFGDNLDEWPYSQRTVMPEETMMRHPDTGDWVRAGYSMDLFITSRRETYLAFILYGHEFVFNAGGPSIKGFEEWLKQHGGTSPLVERLGHRLEYDHSTQPATVYLAGEASDGAGVAFDLAQGIDGLEEP